MDFTRNLIRVHGALSSFSSAASDEEKIKLLEPLFENECVAEKVKMVFFLILNTRLKVTELLKDDPNVGLVTDICPNLTVHSFSCIIVELELLECLAHIVTNCPTDISIELLDCIFECVDSKRTLAGLDLLILGIYCKIYKITLGIHKDSYHIVEMWQFLEKFTKILRDSTWKGSEGGFEDDLGKIMQTCSKCVNIHTGDNLFDNADIMLDSGPFFNLNKSSLGNSSNILENLDEKFRNYITSLLDHFFNMFNTFDSGKFSESFLKGITESAYSLYEALKNTSFEPHNINYLESIKRKPETETEIIQNSDIATIILNINEKKLGKKWYKALVNFDNAINDENALICLRNNLNLADDEDVNNLADLIHLKFKSANSVEENLKTLYFDCMNKINTDDKINHFNKHFSLGCKPDFGSSFDDGELTRMFNKISDSDWAVVKSSLINICIRSPVKTIAKICKQAISNQGHLNFSVDCLKMLRGACSWRGAKESPDTPLINSILCRLIDNEIVNIKEKQLLKEFIIRLQKEKILGVEFIEIFIFEIIRNELINKDFEKFSFAMEVLKSSIKSKLFSGDVAVLVVFTSQVFTHLSWDPYRFSMDVAVAREKVIDVINLLIRTVKFSKDGKEIAWVRKHIEKCSEIDQVYFCDLWYAYDSRFLAGKDLHMRLIMLIHTRTKVNSITESIVTEFKGKELTDVRMSLIASFIKVLPILTAKEWTSLWNRVKSILESWSEIQFRTSDINVMIELLRIFTVSMYSLARGTNRNLGATFCFKYCLRNFGRVVKENFLKSEKFGSDVRCEIVRQILFVLNGIEDESCRKESSMDLSPVVLGLTGEGVAEDENGNELEQLGLWFRNDFIHQDG